jgi:hypothetical protein
MVQKLQKIGHSSVLLSEACLQLYLVFFPAYSGSSRVEYFNCKASMNISSSHCFMVRMRWNTPINLKLFRVINPWTSIENIRSVRKGWYREEKGWKPDDPSADPLSRCSCHLRWVCKKRHNKRSLRFVELFIHTNPDSSRPGPKF